MLILRQKSFLFCTPAWKLDNPYYHILHVPIRKRYYKTLNVKKWLHIYFLIHFFALSSIDWKVFYDKFKNSHKTKTMDYRLFKVNLEFSFSFPGFLFSGLDLVFKSEFQTWDSLHISISISVLTYFSAIADC